MHEGLTSDARVARLTVDQLHAMVGAGILREGEPIELIDGVLVYKDRSARGEDPMTIARRHNLVVKLLARLDADLVARGCHMQTQGPLSLPPYDEPEPDGAVLRGEPRHYAERLPAAADVACIIEVSDASLAYDRTRKLALYARSALPQYLIVNLQDDQIEIYEEPLPDAGRYGAKRTARAAEALAVHVGDAQYLKIDARRILP
jgi:Uma2 family endonuclease